MPEINIDKETDEKVNEMYLESYKDCLSGIEVSFFYPKLNNK